MTREMTEEERKTSEHICKYMEQILESAQKCGKRFLLEKGSFAEARAASMSSLNMAFILLSLKLFPEVSNEDVLKTFIEGARKHPEWSKKKALEE